MSAETPELRETPARQPRPFFEHGEKLGGLVLGTLIGREISVAGDGGLERRDGLDQPRNAATASASRRRGLAPSLDGFPLVLIAILINVANVDSGAFEIEHRKTENRPALERQTLVEKTAVFVLSN